MQTIIRASFVRTTKQTPHSQKSNSSPFTMMILSTWISCVFHVSRIFLVCVYVISLNRAADRVPSPTGWVEWFSVLFVCVCFFFPGGMVFSCPACANATRTRARDYSSTQARARWRRGHCSLFAAAAAHKLAKCACKWCNRPTTTTTHHKTKHSLSSLEAAELYGKCCTLYIWNQTLNEYVCRHMCTLGDFYW